MSAGKIAMQETLGPALKRKSDLHMSRKVWHCAGICLVAVIYNLVNIRQAWMILLSASALIVPLDLLRLKHVAINRAAHRVFGPIMRRHESNSISGMTYLYLGCAFLLLLNKKHIVTLTLFFLAFGDPLASYFGLRYGKDKILGAKTLQGTIAAFAVCTLVSLVYYYFNNIMTERLLIVAPLSGLIGALAELIPIGRLDDNFSFPVISAVLLTILFTIYGGF